MRFVQAAVAASTMLLVSPPAVALSMSEEIADLIDIIAASRCAFIRNGVAYDGAQAADHVKDKYEYYRSDIHSAEDFIALAATKSVVSGRPYAVQCGDTIEPAAEWLTRELANLRRKP